MEDSALFSISDQPDDSSFTPIYNVAHVMDMETNDSNENDGKPKRSKPAKNCCWNCGESGHSLRQCPLPPDPRKINKNRASFSSRTEFKRYHVDTKDESFSHLKPGVISDTLREALGLRNDQLPMHIYRMRSLGYPPGWLLEAKVDHSGIEMFDCDGNRVPNADEEEGEIGTAPSSLYNDSKIITYPGFNAWPSPGTLDETMAYGAPDLSLLPSKDDFILSLKNLKAPLSQTRTKIAITNPSDCDMETEDIEEDINLLPEDNKCSFIPPLPDDSELPPPPPEEPAEEGELVDETNTSVKTSLGTPNSMTRPSIEEKQDPNSEFKDASHGRTKSIELGTPALKIHSPFQRLPPPEAFRKDISDVINFENLPDSTGAYEKLKDVLKGVRSKLSHLKDIRLNNTI